jgi:hypothetical protein
MNDDDPVDAALTIECLEDASRTMWALRVGGFSTNLVQTMREILPEDEYPAPASDTMRPSPPSPRKIAAMDEILGWLRLIDNRTIRRIVALRSITSPSSGKPMSWRSIATRIGSNHHSVKAWHGQGIARIVLALNEPVVKKAKAA